MVYRSRQFGNDSTCSPESKMPDAPCPRRPGPWQETVGYRPGGIALLESTTDTGIPFTSEEVSASPVEVVAASPLVSEGGLVAPSLRPSATSNLLDQFVASLL